MTSLSHEELLWGLFFPCTLPQLFFSFCGYVIVLNVSLKKAADTTEILHVKVFLIINAGPPYWQNSRLPEEGHHISLTHCHELFWENMPALTKTWTQTHTHTHMQMQMQRWPLHMKECMCWRIKPCSGKHSTILQNINLYVWGQKLTLLHASLRQCNKGREEGGRGEGSWNSSDLTHKLL